LFFLLLVLSVYMQLGVPLNGMIFIHILVFAFDTFSRVELIRLVWQAKDL